jgi:NTE family protein
MRQIGIALGGGGIAGAAHLGVLAALEEAGISLYCMAGTSAGALVSSLYASGFSIPDIIQMIPELTRKQLDYDYGSFIGKIFWKSLKHRSLIKGRKFRELLQSKLGEKMMYELSIPVAFVATDLRVGKKVIFTSRPLHAAGLSDDETIMDISLIDAVLASCSIPSIFPPVEIGGHILVDGGLLDNCPCLYARALGADIVIGVDFSVDTFPEKPLNSLLSVVTRSVNIMLLQQSRYLRKHADILLNPDVTCVEALDFDKAQRCVEVGYEYTRRHIDAIRAALDEADHKHDETDDPNRAFPDLVAIKPAYEIEHPDRLMAKSISN